jgi:TolB protein
MQPMRTRHAIFALAAMLLFAAAACGGTSKPAALIVYEAKQGDAVNVYTIDARSAETKQLTHGDGFDGNPAWSPDRKLIIFSSNRNQEDARMNDLLLIDADGANVTPLTSTPQQSEWSPKFSPDGASISYAVTSGDGTYYLGLMNADGSGQEKIAGPYRFVEFPSWKRDASEIYFSAIEQDRNDADIYAIDLATRRVTARISTPAADVCPHFSHDGNYLTYASIDPAEGYEGNVDIFRHDLASDDTTGAADQRLTDDPGHDDYANPSPDDEQYIFISNRDGNFDLYVMDADGSHQRRLACTPDARENVPDW